MLRVGNWAKEMNCDAVRLNSGMQTMVKEWIKEIAPVCGSDYCVKIEPHITISAIVADNEELVKDEAEKLSKILKKGEIKVGVIGVFNPFVDDLKAYKDLENVVPGDVIGYLGSDGTYFSHIMMIADVAAPTGYDVNGKPYWKDGSGIKIIERVYHDTNECWGVVNKRTVEILNKNGKIWSIWRQK